jgi:hypothetical protein
MPPPNFKDISVIEFPHARGRLTVVKITTDQDGRHGKECGPFTQRADLVERGSSAASNRPLLEKTFDRIDDIWQPS